MEGDYNGLEEDEKEAIEKERNREADLPKGIEMASPPFPKTKFIIIVYILATLFSFLNLIYQSSSITLF